MNRYFTAVEIPEKAREQITSYFYPRLEKYVEGKFTKTEKLHITLVFLGNIGIKEEFIDFLGKLHLSLELTVRGIDAFPSIESPKIIYASVYGDLEEYADKINSFLNIRKEKEFTPHLTLCRVKRLIEKIDEKTFNDSEFKFHAEGIHLFNSDFQNYYRIM
jgi:2'-5' RNA ligase